MQWMTINVEINSWSRYKECISVYQMLSHKWDSYIISVSFRDHYGRGTEIWTPEVREDSHGIAPFGHDRSARFINSQ